ncbi:MAG TPA: hypothetical protein PK428_10775 [Phycicoccus sp.]|jgi:hypothetical protein|nr:hypothetical protein [Phycicoccus sp.]
MGAPRVVLVTRRTEYEELLDRHSTRGQAEFFLRSRGQELGPVLGRHEAFVSAVAAVEAAVPLDWRRARVERAELARFVFEAGDIVVVLGQDGLVANVAKYLDGQPVIGVDPVAGDGRGVLVPHEPAGVADGLADIVSGHAAYIDRTMVRATSDDGQILDALNEIFVGQVGHQSARYLLSDGTGWERQSSSGVIVRTGTGGTGWCASLQRIMAPGMALPRPEERALSWFVREAWPSSGTGVEHVVGLLGGGSGLELRCESDELVAFGDGIEGDRLLIGWGQSISVGVSPRILRTLR